MRGKLTGDCHPRSRPDYFNEARALCAGSSALALMRTPAWLTSMRPAHCAREVAALSMSSPLDPPNFNEARALCAGSSAAHQGEATANLDFNEARALCAGSWYGAGDAG